jgi:hypothetical protein
MTASGHNQVVQAFKIIGIPSQYWEGLGDRVDQHPRVGDREQPGILGQDWIVPLNPESGSQTRVRFSSIRNYIPALDRGDLGRGAGRPRGPALAR